MTTATRRRRNPPSNKTTAAGERSRELYRLFNWKKVRTIRVPVQGMSAKEIHRVRLQWISQAYRDGYKISTFTDPMAGELVIRPIGTI